MTDFKPMLAIDLEKLGGVDKIKFPCLVSPKLDGIRAIVRGGIVYSRSLKPIPNAYVQTLFSQYEGFDGELCVGPANAPNVMQATMSGVMSEEGVPDVTFFVFDTTRTSAHSRAYPSRYDYVKGLCSQLSPGSRVRAVDHFWVDSEDALLEKEASYLRAGYEGLMVRSADGYYKHGRCGKKDPWLVKVKRFTDDEAEVVGVEEMMHNANEAFTDELGRTKRSTHQENMVGTEMLGAFVCKTKEGVEFRIGTGRGLTPELRKKLWAEDCVGRLVKFRHFAVTGVKEAPRLPVWLGFRDRRDL